jgi:hypothetical protein
MAKRRGNREGSVYRRGEGRVVGEYADANGKRRYISGKTKTGVQRRLRELLADRDNGIVYDCGSMTVEDYLSKWLVTTKGTVRERTWIRSEVDVRVHLVPVLGQVRLDRLNALQIQALCGRSSIPIFPPGRCRSSTPPCTRHSSSREMATHPQERCAVRESPERGR